MELVDISRIRMDGGTQPRLALDERTVTDYAAAVEHGADFPPVDLFHDGADYWPADGFHRIKAHAKAGKSAVPANVRQGTQADAQWASYAANQQHDNAGLRRTNDDKRRAVEAAIRHPNGELSSDPLIASHVGVSPEMVRKYRGQLPTVGSSKPAPARIGKDGKKRAAPAPKAKAAPKARAAPAPDPEPPAPTPAVAAPDPVAPAPAVEPEEEHDAAEPPDEWAEWEGGVLTAVAEAKAAIHKLARVAGIHRDKNKAHRFTHFITWVGSVGDMLTGLAHVEENMPGAVSEKPPGFIPKVQSKNHILAREAMRKAV